MNPHVESVRALDDYQLEVAFENGERRIFDVKPFLSRGVFVRLRDQSLFKAAKAVAGSVEWPGGLDLSYDTVYLGGRAVTKAARGRDNHPSESRALEIERYLRDPIVGDGVLAPPYDGQVCENLRSALRLLGLRIESGTSYDDKLKNAVLEFQKSHSHANQDGLFGPGTRRLLAQVLDREVGARALSIFVEIKSASPPVVFLSYAWADSGVVNIIDQWLRDHGVVVRRDTRDFKPGQQLPEAVKDAIVQATKVLAVHSANSKDRDWPRFEISVAEQREQEYGSQDILIYLVLDATPLPKHDPHRIAVFREGRTVRQIGEELLRGILGRSGETPRVEFDEDKAL